MILIDYILNLYNVSCHLAGGSCSADSDCPGYQTGLVTCVSETCQYTGSASGGDTISCNSVAECSASVSTTVQLDCVNGFCLGKLCSADADCDDGYTCFDGFICTSTT